MLSHTARHRWRGFACSLALHAAVLALLFGKAWLGDLVSFVFPDGDGQIHARVQKIVLVPTPGVQTQAVPGGPHPPWGGEHPKTSGAPPVEESTELRWTADDRHQLIPVLQAQHGMIVFVSPLDRLQPKAAFWPDESPAPLPSSLEHYVRLRLGNPGWWPEIAQLSAIADQGRTLEPMAVFPPQYRATLGELVDAHEVGRKRSGRVIAVELALDARCSAGAVVLDVQVEEVRPAQRLTTGQAGDPKAHRAAGGAMQSASALFSSS